MIMLRIRILYVLFADFNKGYDGVPRGNLIDSLKSLGCGKIMIKEIRSMYTSTKKVMKSAIIESSISVRQVPPPPP